VSTRTTGTADCRPSRETVPAGAPSGSTAPGSCRTLTWTRDYLDETAALVSAPDKCGQAADPASVAGAVVEAVTRAMSLLRPAGTGRAAHG